MKCSFCGEVEKHNDDCPLVDGNVQNIDDAPPDVQAKLMASLRDAIRANKIEYAPGVKEAMAKDGITEEQLLSMMMKRAGLDS